jgi:hypothetical protein
LQVEKFCNLLFLNNFVRFVSLNKGENMVEEDIEKDRRKRKILFVLNFALFCIIIYIVVMFFVSRL